MNIEPLELLVIILSGIGSGTIVYLLGRVLPWLVLAIDRSWPLPRWIHRAYAKLGGYFWLPCPMCDRMFGGHEIGQVHVRMRGGVTRVACRLHTGPAITIEGGWW